MDVKKQILVVEDESIIAGDISRSLKSMGYGVAGIAISGEKAIKKTVELKPDLVLMDIVLKGSVDGVSAAQHIFQNYNVPIVYLTSHSDEGTLKRAKASGPFGYLIKPFNYRDMQNALDIAFYRHRVESEMRQREQWLSATLKSMGDAVIVADERGAIEYLNPVAEGLTSYGMDEARHMQMCDVFKLLDEETGRPVEGWVEEVLASTTAREVEALMISKGGVQMPVLYTASPKKDEAGAVTGLVLTFHNTQERRNTFNAIKESEMFLKIIFESIHDPFCIFDRDYVVIKANQGYSDLKGHSVMDMVGRKCFEIFEGRTTPCEKCVVSSTFSSADPCVKEKCVKGQDGSEYWKEIYTYPVFGSDGSVSHVIEYTRDITERKKSDEEKRRLIEDLEYISRIDGLTCLLNRRALMECLLDETERARRYQTPLSLIICDIDFFKEVNDSYGHAAGDCALESVAETLKGMIRKLDVAGRYGGDEFMLILPGTSLQGAEEFAERLRNKVCEMDFRPAADKRHIISLSFGVTTFSIKGDDQESMVRRADQALYNSKREGRNKVSVLI